MCIHVYYVNFIWVGQTQSVHILLSTGQSQDFGYFLSCLLANGEIISSLVMSKLQTYRSHLFLLWFSPPPRILNTTGMASPTVSPSEFLLCQWDCLHLSLLRDAVNAWSILRCCYTVGTRNSVYLLSLYLPAKIDGSSVLRLNCLWFNNSYIYVAAITCGYMASRWELGHSGRAQVHLHCPDRYTFKWAWGTARLVKGDRMWLRKG